MRFSKRIVNSRGNGETKLQPSGEIYTNPVNVKAHYYRKEREIYFKNSPE